MSMPTPLLKSITFFCRRAKLQRNFAREPFVAPIKTHHTPELASNYVFYNAGAAPAMRGGHDGRPA
jgi:hypothetical protein